MEKIRAIEEKSEKLQERFRSRVRAAAAAGLTSCQAQHRLRRRRDAFSPLVAYGFEITCCNSLVYALPRRGSCSNLQPTDNTNEQRGALRMQVLLWALYFAIHSNGKIFRQVSGRNKVSKLAQRALVFPIFCIFWLTSVLLRAYIPWRIHQRVRDRAL